MISLQLLLCTCNSSSVQLGASLWINNYDTLSRFLLQFSSWWKRQERWWLGGSRGLSSPPWQLHLQIKNYLSGQNLHPTETASATVPFDVFQREGFVDAGSPQKIFFCTPIFHILSVIRRNQQAEQWLACNTVINSQIKQSLHLSQISLIILICSAAPGQVLSLFLYKYQYLLLFISNFTYIKHVCCDQGEHECL